MTIKTNQPENKNILYYIHCIIFVILTFGIGFLPTFGQITPLGMKVLGVFIGLIYGWIFIGFVWPSIFGMIALGFSGYKDILGVFSSAFGDSTVLQLLFMFIFVATLDASGLTTYVANWFVSRKLCTNRPWVLTAFFFLASFIICGCINLYGGIIILWYIFYNICKSVGFKAGDAYVSYILGGIVFIGALSVMSMPFLLLPIVFNGMVADAAAANNYAFPLIPATIVGLLIVFLSALGYLLLGKYILKIDTSPLKNKMDQLAQHRNDKMTKEQKICLGTLAMFLCIVLIPNLIGSGPIKNILDNIGVLGASCIGIVIQCLRKDNSGKPIYNFTELVQKGVNWDLIILFAATMPVSAAMESGDTGIVSTIVGMLMPIFSQTTAIPFVLLCLVILWITTQFAHNMILIIVFMPTLATVGATFGINPYLFSLLFYMTASCAFMTPGASAQAAMIFGNTEWISKKDAYKYCTIFSIIALLIISCIGLPIGLLLY